MHYNKYFAGHQIAMPPPLKRTARSSTMTAPRRRSTRWRGDVSQFLTWAAEPEMEQRKAMGVKIILFLTVLGGLAYAVKRKVWAKVH